MKNWPILCLLTLGCGPSSRIDPETEAQAASRVFAIAEELEAGRKHKQAIAAYHQVIRIYPGTPEARKAGARISQAQSDALVKVSARKRR